ncbi:DUF4190 domain-containing protein [Agromyces archimandritae]|uniref:DUF4190 domain-containing protein n=1 Tax=Agromyces archimandritae TaxID=2781962 RepID=A0A975FK37_9MICO|nr:DUF4190 domain-containing protein [Agromyces archimandritae]QTX03505.1 DUF4190 domain-containing protein [Agromyces archimandritae]
MSETTGQLNPPPSYSQPPTPPAAPATFPGKGLGIGGLVAAVFAPLVGLILSIIAFVQSKNAGYKNTPAFIGIILSIVLGIVYTVVIVLLFVLAFSLGNAAIEEACAQLGTGVWNLEDGTTLTCD